MKTLPLILLLILIGCNNNAPKSPKFSTEEWQKSITKDSLEKVKRDSIERILAELKAFNNRPWQVGTFTDKFGDPTTDKFVRTYMDGKFSNSATSDEYLFVKILVTKDAIGLFLHEYSADKPAESFSSIGTMDMKNEANEIISLHLWGGWNDSGGNKIYDLSKDSNYATRFKNFLMKSKGIIKVVVTDKYSSVYNFTIDATGFGDEYAKL